MKWGPLLFSTASLLFATSRGVQVDRTLLEEVQRSPWEKNPFFARFLAESFKDDPGQEDLEEGASSCLLVGDLECGDDFDLHCAGNGTVDCTDGCPGDIRAFHELLGNMDNSTVVEALGPRLRRMVEEEMALAREKMDCIEANKKKNKSLLELLGDFAADCGFVLEAKSLRDLFSCGGREFPFGGGDPEPGDIGYVSPDAVEGFGYDYEYDYDDSHRAKRSLNGSGNKCRVAGLRCAEFPMVGQCSGVAVGQCRHAESRANGGFVRSEMAFAILVALGLVGVNRL